MAVKETNRSKKTSRAIRKTKRLSEVEEIALLEAWIESQKPINGTNPLSFPHLPRDAAIGRLGDGEFSPYAGCKWFDQLPLSGKTKDGLKPKYLEMSDIQRASLPHSLCGRDVLGAAKTGSGKTLAFIIPVIEKLYRLRWSNYDGVGSIIVSPTKELAAQLFQELQTVGKYHTLSAGLLIGGRKDVETEKERVNSMNILICTPGRLLQHMDETPNFDCSQLQMLVLDEADRILDAGFKKELDAIISQLPKKRQTLLFSATQTKSVKDLARLSLKDPEYISVHAESETATPEHLNQIAMEVPLEQKLDMLWSFIKSHLHSKLLVFLSSCKQVKFVYEAFRKLRPGIPLLCLHGRMRQDVRMAIYAQFCEKRACLFSTDVASRGLDFPAVDWVIQVDCPEDIAAYIHRVGRTARFSSKGKSILFYSPSEKEMITKLQNAEPKIPIHLRKANIQKMQPISGLLASLLVKYPNLQALAQRAFITYLKSIQKQRDKEVFDVSKLPFEEFAVSLGLPMTPVIRFLKLKKGQTLTAPATTTSTTKEKNVPVVARNDVLADDSESAEEEDSGDEILRQKVAAKADGEADPPAGLPSRVLKKKKLKINVHRPIGTRFVFDEEGNSLPPLAALAGANGADDGFHFDKDEVFIWLCQSKGVSRSLRKK
ncbi:DEA(D/H)-box RNA helicase family protein isoform X2 [Wolffia australiana]